MQTVLNELTRKLRHATRRADHALRMCDQRDTERPSHKRRILLAQKRHALEEVEELTLALEAVRMAAERRLASGFIGR